MPAAIHHHTRDDDIFIADLHLDEPENLAEEVARIDAAHANINSNSQEGEEEEMNRPQNNENDDNTVKDQNFCRFLWSYSICKCFLPLLFIVGVLVGVAKVFGIAPTKDQIPFADLFFSRDSWGDFNADELPKWDTGGSGVLRLEVINALTDDWQNYFEKSIEEWNTGDPDVIDLTVTRTSPDPGCDFVRGKFTICNGDYGDNSFDGVNELLVFGGFITATKATLNEYLLKGTTKARKQYTMCHEIGHGFGLPHSDESFYNLNLGNCMDYTNRPWTNTAPDTATFEFLKNMYGAKNLDVGQTMLSSELSVNSDNLRGIQGGVTIPAWVSQRANEATENFKANFANRNEANEDWLQLHRNGNAAAYQTDLGEGYSVQAHFLLAS